MDMVMNNVYENFLKKMKVVIGKNDEEYRRLKCVNVDM